MSLEYNATVGERTEIAPGLIILRVVPDVLPFRFEAGQYATLGLKRSAPSIDPGAFEAAIGLEPIELVEPPPGADPDKVLRRAYSIASSSRSGEYLEFYLTLVRSGELTPKLFALRPGDRLHLGPKAAGMFTLKRVPEGMHVLLVATGTGLAPYMSMLRSELECGAGRRFVILHGARFSWDLGYRAELAALAASCPNVTYLPVVSRPQGDPSWNGLCGYLQDILFSGVVTTATGIPLDPRQLHVFLCGNPGMIDVAREKLLALGFTPDKRGEIGTIHVEEYW